MTNQEAFDKIVRHLFSMKHRSLRPGDGEECVYRSEDGNKCAIGCLIPDELYNPSFENLGVVALCERSEVIRTLFKEVSIDMLRDLQFAHDSPFHWNDGGFDVAGGGQVLRDIAREHGLRLCAELSDE